MMIRFYRDNIIQRLISLFLILCILICFSFDENFCYTFPSNFVPMFDGQSQSYYELGNVISVTDAMGGTTDFTYDKTSRLLSETNAIGATNKYTYDDKGNLATEENARGDKTTYEYDDFNRLIKISDKAGTVVYTYDNNSNIISISDESGTITKEYDLLNRVTSVTDANGKTVKYSYDELGNILSLTYPGGEIVRYEYYLDGQLKSVIDSSGNKTSYEYDSAGRLVKTTNPDGSIVEESYDKSGNLKTKIDKSSSGEVILSYEYGYDGFGNITSLKDNITTDTEIYSAEPNDGPEENSVSMEYDAANRLISYNGEEVKYDKDGNMIYGPLDGEMVEFKYDCRNRLTKAGDFLYSYDAENLRIEAHYEDYTEEYVLDRVASPNRTLQIIRKDNKAETTEKKTNYYYGIGMIYERSDIDTLIYHYDHLGSTRKITDETGKLRYAFKYDTYGELLSIWDGDESEFYEGSVSDRIEDINRSRPIRFLYNGALGVITDNNNLYYMWQRYYNPAIKRFINQDILTGSISNSQSLNRYAYVQGNPVNYTDPFGLNPVKIIKSYSGVLHDVLNVASIVPGPVGAVTGMINAGLYGLEGNYSAAAKCAVQAGLTAFVGPLAGAAVGGLCKLSKTARVITSIAAIGAGMYCVGTSAYNLYDNSMDLVDAITREKGASASEIFHYFSNMIVSTAGVAYGVNGIAGGVGGLNGISSTGNNKNCDVNDSVPKEQIFDDKNLNNDLSVQHVVDSANKAQSVLDGIDPKYFNSNSRFGGGFYVGDDADTLVAELAEHNSTASYAIRYDMNLSDQKVLDLTDPNIASEWNFASGLSTTNACQRISEAARLQGYNVIKYKSYRGSGNNYVIFDSFESVLAPQMVTPVD